MRQREYVVRVHDDGDVSISSHRHLDYAAWGGSWGLECNCPQGHFLYRQLKNKCMEVGNAIRALDDIIEAIEREAPANYDTGYARGRRSMAQDIADIYEQSDDFVEELRSILDDILVEESR